MKIAIMGSGGIGGYYGARLQAGLAQARVGIETAKANLQRGDVIAVNARDGELITSFGNNGRVMPNPNLRPESGLNGDVGATASWGLSDGTGLTIDAGLTVQPPA